MSTTLAVELKQIAHIIVDMGRGGPTILSVIATGLHVSVDWLYLCKYSYLYTFICRMVVSEMNYLFEL